MSVACLLTLIDTITDLQSRGFTIDFSLSVNGNELLCIQEKFLLRPNEFDICEMHYFPMENSDERGKMIYAIEARNYGLKGILLLSGKSGCHGFPVMIHSKLQDTINRQRTAVYNGIL